MKDEDVAATKQGQEPIQDSVLAGEIKATEATTATTDIASMLNTSGGSTISPMIDATSALHEHGFPTLQHAQVLTTTTRMPTESSDYQVAIVARWGEGTSAVGAIAIVVVHDD